MRRQFNQNLVSRRLAAVVLALFFCLAPTGCGGAQTRAADESGRYCLWLLWLKDPALLKEARQRLEAGDAFMVTAKDMTRAYPKRAVSSADCLPASGFSPQVLKVVSGLEIGQVSQPFPLSGGTALLMRTTDAYRVRGQALYDRGDYQGAEEQFLKDLALHPASAPTWHVLALCRVERNDLPGALKALDQALAWDPANAAVWNDKASALAFLGRGSEALEHFRRAHELSPDNPLIMGNLARAMYLEKTDLKKAAELAARAAKLQPDNRSYRKTLAAIQKALGRQAKAKPPRKKTRLKKRAVVRKAPRKPAPRRKMRSRRKKATPKPALRKKARRKPARKHRAAARTEAPLPLGYKAYIQVATYRKRKLAYQEMSVWLGRGYAARLEPWLKAPGDLRHRVLLGPYGSRSRARKMAARLQRKKWIKAYSLVTRPVK